MLASYSPYSAPQPRTASTPFYSVVSKFKKKCFFSSRGVCGSAGEGLETDFNYNKGGRLVAEATPVGGEEEGPADAKRNCAQTPRAKDSLGTSYSFVSRRFILASFPSRSFIFWNSNWARDRNSRACSRGQRAASRWRRRCRRQSNDCSDIVPSIVVAADWLPMLSFKLE